MGAGRRPRRCSKEDGVNWATAETAIGRAAVAAAVDTTRVKETSYFPLLLPRACDGRYKE